MRLAMRLPPKKGKTSASDASDPRDFETAEVIDLASRNAFPAVTDRKSKSDGLGLAAGVALVFGLGAVTLWSMNAAQVGEIDPVGNPDLAPPASNLPSPAPAVVEPVQPAPLPRRPDPAPAPVLSRTPDSGAATSANPYASPTLTYDASVPANRASPAEPPAPLAGPGNGPKGAAVSGSAAAFAASVGGVGGAPAQATRLTNPSTTVTKGTLIPAILETAINTDVPGYVRAVVSQDVRSFDGTKVLIPRSSRLIGQYQSGVQQGQKRAYVIWEEVITPEGVVVRIGSPAVEFDGTTGLEGKVNSHFFKRFGSAMLLSVIGGLGASLSGGTSVILGGAQTAIPDADISPTIRVGMGEPVRVFASRNLDFSTVAN
ncbi:MAG: TrbI/VirB10 family protein [Pseudomonadota bacterium]